MQLFESSSTDFSATRKEALEQLKAFVPRAGKYSRDRNHVLPGHSDVSKLSPAIRHRLITEEQAAAAPLERYAPSTVEKFTQEIYWRRYWKSWLSLRPQVWDAYLTELEAMRTDPQLEPARERAAECENGCSGIAVMDHFARELTRTGYLHNHARMWFAGWWIHIERLPWQLGADFFFRHLLDGDPASNTLSWRWVAGLQTPGKTYLPRRSNLEKFLAPEILANCQAGIEVFEKPMANLPELPTKPETTRPDLPKSRLNPELPTGVWIHEEDLNPESSPLAHLSPEALLVTGHSSGWRSHRYAENRVNWLRRALADTAARAETSFGMPCPAGFSDDLPRALADWAEKHQLSQIVSLRPEIGPLHDELEALQSALETKGVRLAWIDRPEDLRLRSLATGGFFGFWKKLEDRKN